MLTNQLEKQPIYDNIETNNKRSTTIYDKKRQYRTRSARVLQSALKNDAAATGYIMYIYIYMYYWIYYSL